MKTSGAADTTWIGRTAASLSGLDGGSVGYALRSGARAGGPITTMVPPASLIAALLVALTLAAPARADLAGLSSLSLAPGGALGGAADVAVAADGAHVYAVSSYDDAVLSYSRDSASGALARIGCVRRTASPGCAAGRALDGPIALELSPDGRSLYVASANADAVLAFDRDPVTGALTQAGCVSETGTGGQCADGHDLDEPSDLAVTADGQTLVVTTSRSDAVHAFARTPADGAIAQVAGAAACVSHSGSSGRCSRGRGLDTPVSVALSDFDVWVAATSSDAVASLRLDPALRTLTMEAATSACVSETGAGPCTDGRGLNGAAALAIAPGGTDAIVAARFSDAVTGFRRDPATGRLAQLPSAGACVGHRQGELCSVGRALDGARGVDVSPDGARVLVAAAVSGAATLLARDAASGTLAPLPARSGCVSASGTNGACLPGTGLGGARSIAWTPDGGHAYAAALSASALVGLGPDLPATCPPVSVAIDARARATVAIACTDAAGPIASLRADTPGPRFGAVSAFGTGGFTYTAGDDGGTDVFIVQAEDSGGLLTAVPVTVTVTAAAVESPKAPPAPRRPPEQPSFGPPEAPATAAARLAFGGPPTAAATARGRKGRTRRGTRKPDRVRGTRRDDLLSGAAAGDALFGFAGADRLLGGRGNDRLDGGGGNDRLDGGRGRDVLAGGDGDDFLLDRSGDADPTLDGGAGDDLLAAGPGDDPRVLGGAGSDLLRGGAGRDGLAGGDGGDLLVGGPGDDTLAGDAGPDLLTGGAGTDVLKGGDGDDLLWGGAGTDRFECGAGHDRVYTDSSAERESLRGCEEVIRVDPSAGVAGDVLAGAGNRGLRTGGRTAARLVAAAG